MVEELQHVGEHEFWERFKSVMGPDGLMTYRYLGHRSTVGPDGEVEGPRWRIRRDMRNAAGGLMAAPISIALADAAGVIGDAESVPAPVISSVHVLDPGVDVTEIRVRSSRIHDGRTMGFSESQRPRRRPIRIGSSRLTRGMGVKLAAAPDGYEYVDPGPGVPDSPDLPPLPEAFGAQRRARRPLGDPRARRPHRVDVGIAPPRPHAGRARGRGDGPRGRRDRNSGAPDRGLVGDVRRPRPRRPVRRERRRDRRRPRDTERTACRMTLRDEGNGDRVIASALAVFRRGS